MPILKGRIGKARLRRTARRMKGRMCGDGLTVTQTSDYIDKLLKNDELVDKLDVEVTNLIATKYAGDAAIMKISEDDDVDPEPDVKHPLLLWLWEHREEILKFILSIVMMFMAV